MPDEPDSRVRKPWTYLDWPIWKWAIAGVGVVAVVYVGFVLLFVGCGHRNTQKATGCMNNLSQLGQLCLTAEKEKRLDPRLHGSAQILSWGGVRHGDERVYFCPEDDRAVPETPEERRAFHPADAAALRRAVGLGSYAVRDFERFPLDPKSTEKQIILCDRLGDDGRAVRHEDVIIAVFADGDAQKLTRDDLGIGPDDPIVVGPESPSPVLRVMERP